MGFKTGEFPPVDPATFPDMPYQERIKVLSRHWAEYGFGAPKVTAVIYVAKLFVFSCLGGWLIATLTTGVDPLEIGKWVDEPIIWQKLVIWVMLLEALGVAGSWGPLAGHFKPMTGGVLYYARVGTLRNPPWPGKVPFTEGGFRTPVDVVLFLGFIAGLVVCLALPGSGDGDLTRAVGANEGLIPTAALIVPVVLLILLGLRDKIAFLAARSEQYVPALIFFAFFPFVDMIIAAKLLIVIVWCGAAFSKVTHHFGNVIPPMVSNTPWLSSKTIKKLHYRGFPEDIRPSHSALRLAHGPGTVVEFGLPLVLLFSQNETVTLVAVLGMLGFHVFITSTFPLAVPLEWNALFMFITGFLFLGFPSYEGYAVGDMETGLLIGTVAALLFFPVLGNNRPDLVSFLPSMRQYSGNWASAMWAFAPGTEEKLNEGLTKPGLMQKQQLTAIYGEEAAEVVMQQLLGWRAMHSQGRGLNSVMIRTLGADMDTYTPREAEFSCNAVTGFNFGDGHLHDEHLIASIQERCEFAPGEFMIVWVESEAIFRGYQSYWVMDAAVGIVERGRWSVREMCEEQPWLPNGPVATTIEWSLEGYERVSHAPRRKPRFWHDSASLLDDPRRRAATKVLAMTTAVVVGSGPNGLAAALTLAAEGVEVRVLEAADTLGGGTRSSELTLPGLIHDECSAAHPLAIDTPFSRRFDLTAHGLTWRWPDVQYAHPLDGGGGAAAYRSVDETAAGLGRDGKYWQAVFGPLTRHFDDITADFLRPVLHVPTHPLKLGWFGALSGMPAAVLARLWSRPDAQALFGGVAAHAFRPFTAPMSSAIGVALGTAAHRYGWPVAEGGSRAISRAMISLLEAHGAKLETGVRVASLDELGAPDIVMLDVAPGAAARIAGDRMPPRIARALTRYRHGPGSFKVEFAIQDGVPWTHEASRRAGTVHVGGSYAEIAAGERTTSRGRMPDRPFVLVCQQYLADPSRSRGDVHPLYAYAHVPARWTGDATAQIEAQIERFAPGFRDRILARHVRSVAGMQAHNANYVGGDVVTGSNDPRQLIFRPRAALDPYTTQIPGVYLCSAATPPGAGAHGMCGYNAANSALRRLDPARAEHAAPAPESLAAH